MGFSGSKFTWTRGRYDHTFKGARPDRAMCNVEWGNLFPASSVTHLPKINFDHYPLLIKFHGNQKQAAHQPFHFQATWFTHS